MPIRSRGRSRLEPTLEGQGPRGVGGAFQAALPDAVQKEGGLQAPFLVSQDIFNVKTKRKP